MKNIIISDDIHGLINKVLKDFSFSAIVVLVDENTEKHCYPLLKNDLPAHHLIQIKSGEEEKTLETCVFIWEKMTSLNLDRHALMINLGGGVIGDMGGFCAATYKRGIRFIQIPTTLLSQVDASIGGKLGIDFKHFKNHIGVFKDPERVLIHTPFFKTLPFSEVRSGFAEIIKHCLIADKEKWNELRRKTLEEQDLTELVQHSISVKGKIVEEDPLEKGIRKALNFGHTVGHAVESYFLNKPNQKLLHGEAIAVGMICESYIGVKRGLLSEEESKEVEDYINLIYSPVKIGTESFDEIIALTLQDKKNKDAKVLGAIIKGIGKIELNVELTPELIKESLNYYTKSTSTKKNVG